MDDKMIKTLKFKKIFVRSLFFLLVVSLLIIGAKYHFLAGAQIGQVADNFSVYNSLLLDAQNASPEQIVSYMRYVYNYYPPGTKYVSATGPLADTIERGRVMTLTLLRLKLQEKLQIQFKDEDILSIIEKYGDDENFEKSNYINDEFVDIYKYATPCDNSSHFHNNVSASERPEQE